MIYSPAFIAGVGVAIKIYLSSLYESPSTYFCTHTATYTLKDMRVNTQGMHTSTHTDTHTSEYHSAAK